MFHGKMKAVTFSYDDGTTQDKRLIKMFNRYGLKATFNINSELCGTPNSLIREGVTVAHCRPRAEEIADIYQGHEVAVHTLRHLNLTRQTDADVIRFVEEDRIALSKMVGYEVVGMAYPCGGENNNDHVARLIREHTGVAYSRTITSNGSFELQDNLYRFNPTVYHVHFDEMFELGRQFLALKPDRPQLFYIWGHAFEFDIDDSWDRMDAFCQMISGHEDIFYGTNRDVLLGE